MTPPLAPLPGQWYAARLAEQVKRRPLACVVWGQALVLFRDALGQAAALVDRCAHRGAPLSAGCVRDGRLVCPYHGWEFDAAGQCQHVPALSTATPANLRPVPTLACAERDGIIWVCPTPVANNPGPPRANPFPEGEKSVTLRHAFSLRGNLLDALENFLDATHTHFVHAGLVRAASQRKPIHAVVRTGPDWVQADYTNEAQQSGLINKLLGAGITSTFGRFELPATAHLGYRAGERLRLLIALHFTPGLADQHHVCAVLTGVPSPWPRWLARLLLPWLLRGVVKQDQRILALQADNRARCPDGLDASTELDLFRPHLARLLLHGADADDAGTEKRVTLLL